MLNRLTMVARAFRLKVVCEKTINETHRLANVSIVCLHIAITTAH